MDVWQISVVALAVGQIALVFAVISVSRVGWRRAVGKLKQELEDEADAQNQSIRKLREDFTDYATRLTKRYRANARALAELERRDAEDDLDPEPADVPADDEPARGGGRMHKLPAHVVASGVVGLGRAG